MQSQKYYIVYFSRNRNCFLKTFAMHDCGIKCLGRADLIYFIVIISNYLISKYNCNIRKIIHHCRQRSMQLFVDLSIQIPNKNI